MGKLKLNQAKELSFASIFEAYKKVPLIGPYPRIGISRGDGTVWIDESIIKPIFFEKDVPKGRKVIVFTSI